MGGGGESLTTKVRIYQNAVELALISVYWDIPGSRWP